MVEQYQRVKLTGVWKNTTKNGQTYYAGNMSSLSDEQKTWLSRVQEDPSSVTIQLWPNSKREGRNDPDFNLVMTERKKIARESKIGETFDFGQQEIAPITLGFKEKIDDLADIPF